MDFPPGNDILGDGVAYGCFVVARVLCVRSTRGDFGGCRARLIYLKNNVFFTHNEFKKKQQTHRWITTVFHSRLKKDNVNIMS